MSTTPPPNPTTDRANLRRLAEALMPTEWRQYGHGVCANGNEDEEVVAWTDLSIAAFIAAANPQVVLGLLDEIDRLQAGGCARDQGLTQFCAEAVEREDVIRRLRARVADLESGWANARDTILNERHQLAEEDFGSERINMVLGVLDDNYPETSTDRSPK